MPYMGRRMVRWVMVLAGSALLAACQTVPAAKGFSREQIAALEAAGFARDGENYELGMDDRVLFAFDSADVAEATRAKLAELAHALVSVGIRGATVEGHTDSSGRHEYNQRLSERRAQAVSLALIAGGLAHERVRFFGMGEDDPVNPNSDAASREQNRRVVIVVTSADALPL